MISRITMTRVEPCFWGNKAVNGEISKVKKGTVSNTSSQSQTQNGVDTFTASESSKQKKKTEKITENKK